MRLPAAAVLFCFASPSLAHTGSVLAQDVPLGWPFAPEVLAAIALLAWTYASGMARRRGAAVSVSPWRHASFFAGLAALFAALQSPLDSAAEHSFVLHQVQHLLLQSIGPMLLMLAYPQAALVAGTPQALRSGALAPVLSSRSLRGALGFVSHPAAATLLVVGLLFLWHVPRYHEAALADDAIHYLMHFTLLASGLLFFWRVFDPRPAPVGSGYGARLTMVLAVIAATTPLGAYLALKSAVLYPGYEAKGKLWHELTALQDEQLGGLVMWIPGGLVLAVAVLLVLRQWGGREAALESRGLRSPAAISVSAELRARNRSLALRLLAVAISMMAGTILAASIGRL